MSPANPLRGEYRLGVGPAAIGLRLRPARYQQALAQYFGRAGAKAPAHLRLIVRIVRDPAGRQVPDSLFHDKSRTAGGFTLAGGLGRGRRLSGERAVALRVPRMLVTGQVVRVFEQLLYQAFYEAADAAAEDCVLVHAAGVIRGGKGYLFVGPAGAGKSTVAGLSAADQVLNDEICLLRFTPAGIMLGDTPFNGFFRAKVPGQAPLRALFLLRQGQAHALLPVGRAEAAAAVFQQIVPPVRLDEPIGPAAHARMLEAADRLIQRAPMRTLQFRPDAGFWDEIDAAVQRGELP